MDTGEKLQADLKQVLRLLRIANDMSMKDLASQLGVTPVYISAMESEKSGRVKSLALLDKYSKAFGMRVSDIFRLAEETNGCTYQQKLRKVLDALEEGEEKQPE